MAKSLRSKTKRAFRRVKRTNPASDYAHQDAIRTQRLSARLREATLKRDEEDDGFEDVMDAEEENGETMDTNIVKDKPRISTSGPRDSSSDRKRLRKGKVNRATFHKRKTVKGKGKK